MCGAGCEGAQVVTYKGQHCNSGPRGHAYVESQPILVADTAVLPRGAEGMLAPVGDMMTDEGEEVLTKQRVQVYTRSDKPDGTGMLSPQAGASSGCQRAPSPRPRASRSSTRRL